MPRAPRWHSPSRCASGVGSCSRSRSTVPGRQAEALRALSRARLVLRDELGVEPRAELVALEHAILDHDPALTRPDVRVRIASERCPYKGLESYTADDAECFFGRDLDVAAARRRLAEAGALVVTGGSGSGKSSLVRAGLVPAAARRRRGGRDLRARLRTGRGGRSRALVRTERCRLGGRPGRGAVHGLHGDRGSKPIHRDDRGAGRRPLSDRHGAARRSHRVHGGASRTAPDGGAGRLPARADDGAPAARGDRRPCSAGRPPSRARARGSAPA